jgi:hypothetical protein
MQPPKNPALSPRAAAEILRRQRGAGPTELSPIGTGPSVQEWTTRLRALIRQHQVPMMVRLVGGQNLALAMLGLMGKNRKRSRTRVERWKIVFEERRFWEIPQGIGFDTNGELRDGQHRLTALAESNDVEVGMWVMFGMDPRAVAAIDTGYKRTASQNLGFDDVTYPEHVAAVVRFKYRIDHQGKLPDDELVHRLGIEMAGVGDLLERAIVCGALLRKAKTGATVSPSALAYWLIASQSKRKLSIDEFWDHLVEGHDLSRDNPIFKLRRKLDTLRDVGKKARQYLSQTQQCAWIILAWNVWITGKPAPDTVGWPRHTSTNDLPRVDTREAGRVDTD